MTNYEIIQQLEYIKTITNQKIDMLISQLNTSEPIEQPQAKMKPLVKKTSLHSVGENRGWTEMTGNQIEMPNIEM